MASDAENDSIWWRHHGTQATQAGCTRSFRDDKPRFSYRQQKLLARLPLFHSREHVENKAIKKNSGIR